MKLFVSMPTTYPELATHTTFSMTAFVTVPKVFRFPSSGTRADITSQSWQDDPSSCIPLLPMRELMTFEVESYKSLFSRVMKVVQS